MFKKSINPFFLLTAVGIAFFAISRLNLIVLFNNVSDGIYYYMHDEGLRDFTGNKVLFRNKAKHIFICTELDCTSLSLEKNKIILAYHWRKFISQNTDFRVAIILKLKNKTEAGVSEIQQYINGFNNTLQAMKEETLMIALDDNEVFCNRYKLSYPSALLLFSDNTNNSSHALGSFYMHLYSPDSIVFVDNFTKIVTNKLEMMAQEPMPPCSLT